MSVKVHQPRELFLGKDVKSLGPGHRAGERFSRDMESQTFFEKTHMWEFLDGDPYVTYRVPKCVSDDSF